MTNLQTFTPLGYWLKCYSAYLHGRYIVTISSACTSFVIMADAWAVVDDFGDLVKVQS